jgi:hypothetical protein
LRKLVVERKTAEAKVAAQAKIETKPAHTQPKPQPQPESGFVFSTSEPTSSHVDPITEKPPQLLVPLTGRTPTPFKLARRSASFGFSDDFFFKHQ